MARSGHVENLCTGTVAFAKVYEVGSLEKPAAWNLISLEESIFWEFGSLGVKQISNLEEAQFWNLGEPRSIPRETFSIF